MQICRTLVIGGPTLQQLQAYAVFEEALQAGIGLDVFDQEPLRADCPLRTMDKVVLTPHLGYATRDTFESFYRSTVEGLLDYLLGRPHKLLNPQAREALRPRAGRAVQAHRDPGSPFFRTDSAAAWSGW